MKTNIFLIVVAALTVFSSLSSRTFAQVREEVIPSAGEPQGPDLSNYAAPPALDEEVAPAGTISNKKVSNKSLAGESATHENMESAEGRIAIAKDENSSSRSDEGLMCRSQTMIGNVETCRKSVRGADLVKTFNGEPEEQFKIRPDSSELPVWEFSFRDGARQDMGFSMESKTTNFEAMVFPRKTVPTIQSEGDNLVVTLATGEKVTYNAKTAKVISGVLSDRKGLSYTGTGVMVKVLNTGLNKKKDAALNRPNKYKNGKTVEITKLGSKTCYANVKDLWTSKSGEPDHFKFASDEAFNGWLKKKCSFTL